MCGGIVSGESSGIIKSPKYPADYPPSTTCEWDVSVRNGRTINVRFDNMQIASDPPNCQQDYVIVSLFDNYIFLYFVIMWFIQMRNGDSVDSPVLGNGRLCGNTVPSGVFSTSSNRLHVKFVSDALTNAAVICLYYSLIWFVLMNFELLGFPAEISRNWFGMRWQDHTHQR